MILKCSHNEIVCNPYKEEVALLEATNSWVKWLGVWALEPDVRSIIRTNTGVNQASLVPGKLNETNASAK